MEEVQQDLQLKNIVIKPNKNIASSSIIKIIPKNIVLSNLKNNFDKTNMIQTLSKTQLQKNFQSSNVTSGKVIILLFKKIIIH